MSLKQVSYANNLPCDLGTALYSPIRLRQYSGRVGDVAFLHEDGKYEWIRNAFDPTVLSFPPYVHCIQAMYLYYTSGRSEWGWPDFSSEGNGVVRGRNPAA